MEKKTQAVGIEEQIFGDESRGRKRLTKVLNSAVDWVDGMESIFDFSKVHNSGTRFLNVFFVTGFNIGWLFVALALMAALQGFHINQIQGFLSPLFLHKFLDILPQAIDQSALFEFFFACILAPFWETLVFVCLPVFLAKLFTNKRSKRTKNAALGMFVVCTSIIFGILHHGPQSIPIQGVGGLLYCWLYLRNKSALSPAFAHSIWNLMVLFGFPVL